MIRFNYRGIIGAIVPGGFVLWGGKGFHSTAAVGGLQAAINKAQVKSKRRASCR